MKRILVIVLGASTLFEFYLAAGVLLRPESMMADFGITALNNEVLYMACIVGWFCLLATLFAGLATFWVYRGKTEGFRLSLILGLFWVGIGLHLGVGFDRPQHLFLDAAKGALILALTYCCLRQCGAQPSEGKNS